MPRAALKGMLSLQAGREARKPCRMRSGSDRTGRGARIFERHRAGGDTRMSECARHAALRCQRRQAWAQNRVRAGLWRFSACANKSSERMHSRARVRRSKL